jgi:hypothetical protein
MKVTRWDVGCPASSSSRSVRVLILKLGELHYCEKHMKHTSTPSVYNPRFLMLRKVVRVITTVLRELLSPGK